MLPDSKLPPLGAASFPRLMGKGHFSRFDAAWIVSTTPGKPLIDSYRLSGYFDFSIVSGIE
jgi:hypothetical protein